MTETVASESDLKPHPAETAGRLMSRRFLACRPGETVGAVLAALASGKAEVCDPVIAVDGRGHYVGAIGLAVLAAGRRDDTVDRMVDRTWPTVGPHADQEHVAELARVRRVAGVPVVSKDGRPLGCIPAACLLDVLWREHTEDMHRLAGIAKPMAEARATLDEPPYMRVRHRLPWLVVGLVGSSVATMVMASFESTFADNVKLAFFVPAIVYLADAIGTQTETVTVRGLSISHRPFLQLLLGEMATGLLIGGLLGLLVLAGVGWAFHDMRLAATVAVTVMAAGTIATTVGMALPWALSRAGIDPAFGSGPLATIVQDVLSILIYFVAVSVIMV